MYLIVGLGNPGRQYEATRHNMGFDVIDKLVEEYQVPQAGVKFNAMYGKGRIGGQPVILMKPLSYMNFSGAPIRDMANYFKIDPETEMIVVYTQSLKMIGVLLTGIERLKVRERFDITLVSHPEIETGKIIFTGIQTNLTLILSSVKQPGQLPNLHVYTQISGT